MKKTVFGQKMKTGGGFFQSPFLRSNEVKYGRRDQENRNSP